MNKSNVNEGIEKKIKELEEHVEKIRRLKEEYHQRRTIVIEFAGCPKSGKTTCINSLNLFLKRNDFKTKIISEKASICPMKDKRSPDFNIWTFTQLIADYLENIIQPTSYDFILIDRGLFDALCWFNYLKEDNKMDKLSHEITKEFVNMSKWKDKTDFVWIFKAKPEISLQREYAHLLTKKRGTIMNEKILENYSFILDKTKKEFENEYYSLEEIDTSELKQNEVNYQVTKKALIEIEKMLDENIGVYDKSVLSELKNDIISIKDLEKKEMLYFPRSEMENSEDYIQPIVISVLIDKHNGKVLVCKKNKESLEKNSPEKGKKLLWVGGHIRKDDLPADIIKKAKCKTNSLLLKKALEREIKEELGISITVENEEIEKAIIIYRPNSKKSKKHFAICCLLNVDSKDLKMNLDGYEFKTKRDVSFVDLEKLDISEEYDSWSIEIAKKFLGKQNQQITIDEF